MTVSCFMYKQQLELFLARLQLQQSPQRDCCSLVSAVFGAHQCHLQMTGAGFPHGYPDPCVIHAAVLALHCSLGWLHPPCPPRCGCVTMLKSPNKVTAVKQWEQRWIKNCLCGGLWRKMPLSYS